MSNSLNILVTGSSGFIGRAISTKLLSLGYAVVAPLRQPYLSTKAQDIYFERAKLCVVGPINSNTSWLSALTNVSTVVHCAALAHDKSSYGKASLAKYREVNVSGTIQLAMQSANAGVKRFIFLSTIGVNGNLSSVPFSETTDTNPHNDYALSKLEAERALFRIADKTGMEVIVIRCPLVYGTGAPGNFGHLIKWVQRGIPLPLGDINNKRSFVAITNLVDFILKCINPSASPQAANQLFVISDDEDVSTTKLIQKVAKALGCSCNLFVLPVFFLRGLAFLTGKKSVADQLTGNLQVDIAKIKKIMGWNPLIKMDQQLSEIFESSTRNRIK